MQEKREMYDKYGKLDLDDFSMEDFTEMMFGEGGMMEKVRGFT